MLTVTAQAKEKLREVLARQTMDAEVALRVTPNHPMQSRLELVLDRAKKGDQVVQAQSGVTVLLICSDLSEKLTGIMLDYGETTHGPDFVIARDGYG